VNPAAQGPRVCFPFIGHVVGGSHLSSLLLIEGLRASGSEVVVAVHREGPLTRLLTDRKIPWLHVPVADGAWSTDIRVHAKGVRGSLPDARSLLRQHGVDLVHTNDGRIHRLWGLAAKASRLRWVWHHRTPFMSRPMSFLAQRADAVLTVSEYARRQLPTRLAARTLVIDNPFEHPTRRDAAAARLSLHRDFGCVAGTAVVGYVSNLRQPRKRPTAFVEIASILTRQHGIDAVFPLFGAASPDLARAVEERRIALGLADRCQLLGTRMPIAPWVAACDVLVVPARHEPFGRTLVEAALLGVPVVATDEGGHPEIIEHGRTGLLFPPEDLPAAAAMVARLLTDGPMAARLGDAARSAARQRFTTDRHVELVTQVYRRVLG
jgi:glycosyltransferase involved in cell wall biosynthesis